MSNNLNREEAGRSVGPLLGPNCLQKFSADYTKEDKELIHVITMCAIKGLLCTRLYEFDWDITKWPILEAYGPRSDCSFRSSLIEVHSVCSL